MEEPVQRIAFILQQGSEWSEELLGPLREVFGPVCYAGQWYPFDRTRYYEPEMGHGLYRAVIGFSGLMSAASAVEDKLRAVRLETRWLAENGGRRYNIDVGYLDTDKIVLTSLKRGPFKIYGRDGVWLDLVMTYAKGCFSGSPRTFEDFLRNPYQVDLIRIREIYKRELKKLRMRKE